MTWRSTASDDFQSVHHAGSSPDACWSRRLPRVRIVACDELLLHHSLGDEVRETRVTAYLEESKPEAGTRRILGTLYLEMSDGVLADWYSVGPLLAEHLELGALGDAFALILGSNSSQRRQFLRARGLDDAALIEARVLLNQDDFEPDLLEELEKSFIEASLSGVVDPRGGESSQDSGGNVSEAREEPGEKEDPSRPDLVFEEVDLTRVVMSEASPDATWSPDEQGQRSSLGGGGAGSPPSEGIRKQIGDRGEGVVLEKERERVVALGLPIDRVNWVARDKPLSPFDITSLDEAGKVIYIEVKSTIGLDPTAPFDISIAELRWMMENRDTTYVYRVTDVASAAPAITVFEDPIGWWERNAASLDASSARMAFHVSAIPNRA